MKAGTIDALARAFLSYRMSLNKALSESAIRAFMRGDARAFSFMHINPSAITLRAAAERFASQYTDDLVQRGGSMVWDPQAGKSVFKPWLSDWTKAEREDVVGIIERGLKEGKYPGVKERVKGGYSEGTIASDLEDYFHTKRSHATMVARTESKRIQNQGMLDRYSERGYETVLVMDDEGPNSCSACEAANGQEWTLEEAQEMKLEHPNCVRDFAPVVSDFPYTPEDRAKLYSKNKEEKGMGCQAGNQ